MCLKAIIAYYHPVFLHPHTWTLLIWDFDLHVNVVNFHIIKIHESNTIGRPGSCLRATTQTILTCELILEYMQVPLLYAQVITDLYWHACMWFPTMCEYVLFVQLDACVGMFHREFGIGIMHWSLTCNYWRYIKNFHRGQTNKAERVTR